MATEIISSIRATGGDYTSLTAWEAAIPTDLITLDEQHIAECYDDWPTGLEDSLLISARTTDTTRNIVIRAAEDHEFDFVTKTGFYIESTVWNKRGIELTGSVHVTVKNIGIYINSSSGDGIKFKDEVPGLVENVSVWERSAGGLNYGFIGGGHGTRCINCIVEGAGIRGYYTGWIKSAEFLNCIAVDCATGFQSNGTLGVAKNCVAYNCTISYANISATDTANNAATDGATNTPPGASPYTSDVLSADFIDVANDDFHLSATSGLIGQGANLSADFTTDIDGDTRLASGAWDIGIDHYVAAGGGVTGDLASIEPTIDSFSAAGVIPATGALLTTEQDIDTFQASGAGEIFGSLDAIESAIDNFQASGASKITGTLSSTELSIDVIVINGEIVVSGDLVSTEPGVDSFISNGNVSISGDLAAQELLIDTAFISGSNSINGFLSVAESSIDLFSSIGTILITGGVLAQEQQTDSLLITGHLDSKGSLDATELLNDSFLSFGGPIIAGDMAAIELNIDLFLANGGASTIGNFAAQELSIDSFASDGNLLLQGQLSAAELSIDVFSANGSIIITGNLSSQEPAIDIFAGGLSAEDFMDFKDSIFISGFNTKLHINNINTDIQQR